MIYKNIFLTVLLMPFVITSYNDIELKNDRNRKELELSNISKAIAEKELAIDALWLQAEDIYETVCESLDEQKKREFTEEVNVFQQDLNQALAAKEDIKPFLIKEFIERRRNTRNELARLKHLIIKHNVEYDSLKKLFKDYEKTLQELIELNNKLDEVQKQTLNN